MSTEITTAEAIQMMNRCKQEILDLRAAISRLEPKADAYDNLVIVLRLLPQPPVGYSEDMVWTLDKRIRELKQNSEAKSPMNETGEA